ncbi:MAG: hypothetical protein L6R41_001489, partial [Letrouitia leprolyta]
VAIPKLQVELKPVGSVDPAMNTPKPEWSQRNGTTLIDKTKRETCVIGLKIAQLTESVAPKRSLHNISCRFKSEQRILAGLAQG